MGVESSLIRQQLPFSLVFIAAWAEIIRLEVLLCAFIPNPQVALC